jgi:cobaltochelatase CobN
MLKFKKPEKKPSIALISSMVSTTSLTNAIIEIKELLGDVFEFYLFFINDLQKIDLENSEIWENVIQSEIILLDIRGNNPVVEKLISIFNHIEQNEYEAYKHKQIVSLVGGNAELRELTKLGNFEAKKIPAKGNSELAFDVIPDLTEAVKKGIKISTILNKIGKILPFGMMRHVRNWGIIMDYWVYGYAGVHQNHRNMLLFLLKEYLGFKTLKVDPPLKIPSSGIFNSLMNQYFTTLQEYLDANPINPLKQTIGIFYYGGIYFEQTIPILTQFMQNLTEFNIIPVYAEVLENLEALQSFFQIQDHPIVDLLLNLQYFQINGGPFGGNNTQTLNLYTAFNVPQMNPIINFDMPLEDYLEQKQGILPINQVIAVIMPELDGRIEMMNVGCMESYGYSDEINSQVYDIIPLEDNIAFICHRIKKWLRLRKKPNSEKKVAIVLYDYPPGETTLGNASYLDTFQSLSQICQILHNKGYSVDESIFASDLLHDFLSSGLVNNPEHVSLHNYQGLKMGERDFQAIIPDLPSQLQNTISETWGPFPGKIMHEKDKVLLPIKKFGNIFIGIQPPRASIADVSHEYHNKELLPHYQYLAFYRYLDRQLDVDAIIHLGTHGTLEFLPGKECNGHWTDFNHFLLGACPNIYLYHVSNTSESSIAKRRSNAVIINHSSPPIILSQLYEEYQKIENLILEYEQLQENPSTEAQSLQNEICAEIEVLTRKLNISYRSIEELAKFIYRLKTAAIPEGLHSFAKIFTKEQSIRLIVDILLHSEMIDSSLHSFTQWIAEEKEIPPAILENIVSHLILGTNLTPSMDELRLKCNWDLSTIPPEGIDWLQNLYQRIQHSQEEANLIKALDGGYILPGFGGDPIRSPDIFPTGRNSFGFDPRLIPSSIACQRGSKIARTLLADHLQSHGKYPESVSVVLWAFETMKTGGETIGQIFEYLGVKAAKHKSVWTTELEIIPLEELAHPRINVIITICGIFRDTFPYHIDLINQAIALINNLDENSEQNFIKKSQKDLLNRNIAQPLARIYGPPPGKYNTNLTDIINQGSWEIEEELAADYIKNMGFAYLPHQNIIPADASFRALLKNIDFVSQVRDGVEYQITDLDHYYEFSGGLARAIRSESGKNVPIFIADTASKNIHVAPIEDTIQEGIITRNLNPQWIDGMLNHAHQGGQKVAERMENMMGLTATTERVANWVWEKTYEKYFEDEQIKDRLIENNRFAMMDMINTFLEANQRGYWQTEAQNLKNLKKLYLILEGWVEKTYA